MTHSEQDALNVDALERAYRYTSGPRQRLQPGGDCVSHDKMEHKRFDRETIEPQQELEV